MARRTDNRRHAQVRLQVVREAARLMSEEGIGDYGEALQRAARKLGLHPREPLPERHEIEEALRLHHELFHSNEQPQELRQLRQTTLHAMQLLAEFSPRLIGRVLEGSADRHTPIQLQLFAERNEAVGILLHHHHIPYRLDERLITSDRDRRQPLPLYRFHAGDHRLELLVYPTDRPRQPPNDPLDGRPMPWVDRRQLKELLLEGNTPVA